MFDLARAMFWLLVILVFIIAAFVGVMWIRRNMQAEDSGPGGAVFGLGELRAMLRSGQISQEEFDRLKAQMLESYKPKPGEGERPEGPKSE